MNIKETILELNIDEKLSLLTGINDWETFEIERLNIPSVFLANGPHGVIKQVKDQNGNVYLKNAVCFPTSSAMAATWNCDLIHQVGIALGEECRDLGVDIILGPGTNIKRMPICGRNFEYYSEDPVLAGELTAAYINGIQSVGVGACLKHFAANNQEFDRAQVSSEVDIRTLREIYLKPFEIAVKKAQPWSIMCGYNRLNGIYCSENKFLLNDLLREEWGYDGIVISDWGAVHDKVKSLKASLELEMPCNVTSVDILKQALASGDITEKEIDAILERLLKFINRISFARETEIVHYELEKHNKLAKNAALEAITLLKNQDHILPILSQKVKKLAIIGLFAKEPVIQGGGSASVQPNLIESPYECIKEIAGSEIEIDYSPAYLSWGDVVDGLNVAMQSASNADMAVLFVGNRTGIEGEGYDRANLKLSQGMENIILRISEQNPNTVVVVEAGSAMDMSAWIDKVKAVVFTWYGGQMMGSAIAEILFGLSNPCGKIAETFPVKIEDTPSYSTYPGNGYATWYSEGIMVGYRYYDTFKKEVSFPFGFGLSYTTFEYSNLKLTVNPQENNVTVQFKLKNSGNMQGKEIVQLYIKEIDNQVLRPEKELKAFDKIDLKPNEEKDIIFVLSRDAFSYFNTSLNDWHVDGGRYDILIGSSSRDIRLTERVQIV